MKYKDPVDKVLKLLESNNINPGNLLIGQVVKVEVTDAKGNKFLRDARIGEIYPDGAILIKDVATNNAINLQFQWDESEMSPGLIYKSYNEDFGITYKLVISKDLMSNQSITKLDEKQKVNEAKDVDIDKLTKLSMKLYDQFWEDMDDADEEDESKIGDKYIDKVISEFKKLGIKIDEEDAFSILEEVQGRSTLDVFEKRIQKILK